MEVIKTEVYYKTILQEKVFLYGKTLLFSIGVLIPVLFFTDPTMIKWSFPVLISLILFLCLLDFGSRRNKTLLSVSLKGSMITFEYLHIYWIFRKTVPLESISIKQYYKMYGKFSLLTLEFKANNKLLIEIREDEEYGWDNFKKAILLKKLCPPVPYEDRSHMGKRIRFLGREMNVQR